MFTCSILFAGYMNLYRKLKRKQIHTIPSSRVVTTAVMSNVCNTLLTKLGIDASLQPVQVKPKVFL